MFEKELNKLIESEDNIECIKDLISKNISNTKQNKKNIERLLEFSMENRLFRSEAWGYYFIGWYYLDNSEYENAAESFMISYELFDKLNNKYEIAYACNGLTNVYCLMGQFKLSNEWGLKGISFCEETRNNKAMLILLINTCINYIQMEYYDKALEIVEGIEGIEEIKGIDYELTKSQEISYMLVKAEIEINIGCPGKALKIIEQAMKIESVDDINSVKCEMFKLKGMAYLKTGEYDLAEVQFEKSYNFSVRYDLIYEKCSAMLQWSKLCMLTENYEKAIELLSQIIIISSSNKFNTIMREAFHSLYSIYKEQEETEKALNYLEKYMKINDEMYDYEQSQLMAEMNLNNTKRVAEQYKQLYKRTELLSSIGQRIISNLDMSLIIRIIHEEISKLIDVDYFGIAVYDSKKNQSEYYFMKNNKIIYSTVKYDQENTLGGYCIRNKEDIIIGNEKLEFQKYLYSEPEHIKGFEDEGDKISSIIYTPMIINEKVVGLMTAQSEKENLYGKDELNILKILANYTAIAVENVKVYKEIENIATYDSLTKFLTKTEILKIGDSIYEKAKYSNDKFTVVMIDLDDFKIVNDTYGHVYGDKAMSLIAETMSKCIRNTDYIGRFGGDEFLLICSETGIKEALYVAERIRKTIQSSVFVLNDEIKVRMTTSLGVHEYDENDNSFTDVVKRADQCLYLAKETRNTVMR
jgi:diguanylate cyclase (GGDEF)-like protein